MLTLIHGLWRAQDRTGQIYWSLDRTTAALWLLMQEPVSSEKH